MRTPIVEGDLVEVYEPVKEKTQFEGTAQASVIFGWYDDGNSATVMTGTTAIAFHFDGSDQNQRRWWLFLTDGRKVSLAAKFLKHVERA